MSTGMLVNRMGLQECDQEDKDLRSRHLEDILRDVLPGDEKVLGSMMNVLDIMASKTNYTRSA